MVMVMHDVDIRGSQVRYIYREISYYVYNFSANLKLFKNEELYTHTHRLHMAKFSLYR